VTNPEVKAKLAESRDKFAMPPDAIARAIAFAIEQPADVVVAVNTVHWFSLAKAAGLFGDIFQSLRAGGVFLLVEPVGAEPPFAPGFNTWRKEQPSQHRYEDWRRFWSRVNALLGYDYGFLGEPDDQNRIGDRLSVMQWVGLLTDAGFESIDILLRDAEKVVLASVKP